MNTTGYFRFGPGVVTVAGSIPPGIVNPDPVYGPGYIGGVPTVPGMYSWNVNGLAVFSAVSGGTGSYRIVPFPVTVSFVLGSTVNYPLVLERSTDGGVTWNSRPATLFISNDFVGVPCGTIEHAIPPGLNFNANGTITGVPTLNGSYGCWIMLYDSTFTGISTIVNIAIFGGGGGSLAFICGGPPTGTVDTAYSHTFPASGGTAPYTFALLWGVFPPGLSLNAATGSVGGVPVVPGTFAVHLSVTDDVGAVVAIDCSITILAAVAAVLVLPGTAASPIPLPDPTKGPCVP
jgi:hypothetical protein